MVRPQKKNPQDATLRNVRSAAAKIAHLQARVRDLERRLDVMERRWQIDAKRR